MRAVIQRVKKANVTVESENIGEIKKGFVVLIGIDRDDDDSDIDYIVNKTVKLRVFEDSCGKMNRSIEQAGGQLLLVSQFTLQGDVRKGNRPSFTDAMPPNLAKPFYDKVISRFKQAFNAVQCGEFAADMDVMLINDGPVTILLDSKRKF
jgi:D-aminoacyl-tRNA deacylase